MRRKFTMAVLILVSIILQSTVCQMISIASIKPNLLIILTVWLLFVHILHMIQMFCVSNPQTLPFLAAVSVITV